MSVVARFRHVGRVRVRRQPGGLPLEREVRAGVAEPRFRARPVIGDEDARTLATEILAMRKGNFRAAFRDSAMKRTKLTGLRRNAAVVFESTSNLGN